MKKEDILKKLWENNIIITKNVSEKLDSLSDEIIDKIIKEAIKENIQVLDINFLNKILGNNEVKSNDNEEKNILSFFGDKSNKKIVEKKEVNVGNLNISIEKIFEKNEEKTKIKKEVTVEIYNKNKKFIGEEIETNIKELNQTDRINILKKFEIQKNKPDIASWISYYKSRLNKIKKILKEHAQIKELYPLDKIPEERENVAIAGLIYDKRITDKGIIFIIEDGNSIVKVFVDKNNENVNFKIARDIPLDSVIAFVGRYHNKMFFADDLIFPDVPIRKPKTYGDEDVYILFTGDWQIGNKYTFYDLFDRFLNFLNEKTDNEKINDLARKIGYLLVIGDVVDGVGVYPEQKDELIYKTFEEQYQKFEEFILNIPEFIKVAIIPGNHDIPRLAEPQPPLSKSLLKQSYEMENILYLSNPSYVQLHNSINVLMYHGYVLDWLVSSIPILREKGGYENPGELMKFLLMLRLLAPTHGSTPYIPYLNDDPLVIDILPDIFHTGHIHRASYDEYRGIDMINSSTFQDITPYQKELGHKPNPGFVFLRNIKNGEALAINLFDYSIVRIREKVI
jgi:DNA polymerase II small subunit